jgi:hypothetical protein
VLVVTLLGVVNDGRTFNPRVPQYGAQQVDLPLGVSALIRVEMVYPDGTPAALDGSYSLTVKRSPMALSVPVGFIKTASATGNIVEFTITPADTAGMPPRRYIFDVWRLSDDDRTCLVPVSPFVILPTSGRPT